MKTVQDYLGDPRITTDLEMMTDLEPIKEIHAIRLKIQDEIAGMTIEEERAYYKEAMDRLFEGTGYTPEIVNCTGQGKRRV